MRNFGYLEKNPTNSEALYSEEAIIVAIKEVQKFGAIPQTGYLDTKTLQVSINEFEITILTAVWSKCLLLSMAEVSSIVVLWS
jgi:hypothetical protein